MIPVSERWGPTVETSHSVVSRVEVWRDGVQLVEDLPVAGGTVTVDAGADVMFECRVEVSDPTYLPEAENDPLMPFGSELKVYLGVVYPDRSEEAFGVFSGPIVSAPTWPTTRRSFEVVAVGWLQYVNDDRFILPYSPSGGTIQAITDLLALTLPDLPLSVDPGIVDATISGAATYDENRMEALTDLAASLGGRVVDTRTGTLHLGPIMVPDPSATPVRKFIYGASNTMLSTTDAEVTREERFNGVFAYHTEDPDVYHLATLDTGPLAWGGPFGRKVLYYASPLLTADTVADAATTRLEGLKGRSRKITAAIAPDPSLQPGDHVQIQWPPSYRDRRAPGLVELAQIRKVVHPIGPGQTQLEMRGVS